MRDNIGKLIIFLSGLGIGGVTSWIITKKHYEAEMEAQIESVKNAFADRLDKIEDEKDTAIENISKSYSNTSKDVAESIVKSSRKAGEKVDYTSYFSEEDDHPHDDGEDEILLETAEPEVTIEEKPRGRKPRIIKEEEYGNMVGYDYGELYYYQGDGVLVNDSEDIIDNPEALIGDALTKYGFVDSDETVIYVRNDSLSTDYEITKVFSSWSDV